MTRPRDSSDPPTSTTPSSTAMVAGAARAPARGRRAHVARTADRGRLRPARDHDRVAALGAGHRDDARGRPRAVPDLRQARAVVGAAPVLRVRAAGVPRDGRGRRALAHRAARLPLGPRRPAARRADACRGRSASSTSTSSRPRSGSRRSTRDRLPWDLARYGRAAYLLGRLAASPAWRERRDVGAVPDCTIRDYVEGRLGGQVLPALRDEGLWHHPLVAGAFDDELRDPDAGGGRPTSAAYADELPGYPRLQRPRRRLPQQPARRRRRPTPSSLIDFGFWLGNPVGFDLGQLLVGDVQIGRRSADLLAEIEERDRPGVRRRAARRGLRPRRARRPPGPRAAPADLHRPVDAAVRAPRRSRPRPSSSTIAADRAAIARFSLDLLEATGG